MEDGTMSGKRVLLVVLVTSVVMLAVGAGPRLPDASAAQTSQIATATWTFQGRVYSGNVGDETHPLEGVTVTVYGANNPYPDPGTFIRSTTTDSEGWYGLPAC